MCGSCTEAVGATLVPITRSNVSFNFGSSVTLLLGFMATSIILHQRIICQVVGSGLCDTIKQPKMDRIPSDQASIPLAETAVASLRGKDLFGGESIDCPMNQVEYVQIALSGINNLNQGIPHDINRLYIAKSNNLQRLIGLNDDEAKMLPQDEFVIIDPKTFKEHKYTGFLLFRKGTGVIIGRDKTSPLSSIFHFDQRVSNQHLEISWNEYDQLKISDLNSTNGTTVYITKKVQTP